MRTPKLVYKDILFRDALKEAAPDGMYEVVDTSYTRKIKGSLKTIIIAPSFVGLGLIKLMGAFRAEVRKNMTDGKILMPAEPPEFSRCGPVRPRWQDAEELDLSAAYLTAALEIGAIGKGTYERVMKFHKTTRLKLVGSLGTRRSIHRYEAGRLVESHSEEEPTAPVWKAIQAEVDWVMREAAGAAGKGFLYYWVDAIFCYRDVAERVRERVEGLGYRMKSARVTMKADDRFIRLKDGRVFPKLYHLRKAAE